MRLYKKAAVCLLAAAMAVSMMTACGGGAGGGSSDGGSSGGNEVVEPVPDPGDVDTGDNGTGSDTATKKTLIADPNTSKYAQVSKNVFGANEFYAKETTVEYDASNSKEDEIVTTLARKGDSVYLKVVETKNNKTTENTIFQEATKDGKYTQYLLFESDKAAIKGISDKTIADFSSVATVPNLIYSTTVKVGGKEYYAETYTDKNGAENIICFGENGYPKYQFVKYKNGTSDTVVYQDIQVGNSKNLCTVDGYKVYTQGYDKNGTPALISEDGKTYPVQVTYNNGKVSDIKVFDENGNDVTKDFGWFVKLYKG